MAEPCRDISRPSLRSILKSWRSGSPESRNQVLVQDLYSRRLGKLKKRAYRTLKNLNANPKVVDIHTTFANDVWTECDAPFGLLLGLPVVEQYLNARSKKDCIHVPLEPIRMAFDQTENRFQSLSVGVFVEFHQHGFAHNGQRLVFYSYHPELFSRGSTNQAPGFQISSDPNLMRRLSMDRMIDVCARYSERDRALLTVCKAKYPPI
ncbi:hypothetical protein IQ07DRAFT_168859 [Pyrenochaeta sp. DS3sAY3a]|nr:hypothetical protein IQ07DRAFT_168859 [Pyrenochaeta sp. DS3sAY3a]